jgi:hypothetical protein
LTPKFHKKLEGDIRNKEKRRKKKNKSATNFYLFLIPQKKNSRDESHTTISF